MRYDQARSREMSQKVFEQNLSTQVQKVRWFVEHQQIRIVQQQRCQLHASLPTAGEPLHRAVQVMPLQFEFGRHFAALPIRLTTVSNQKIHRRFASLKRIMLTQVANTQMRRPHDGATVHFLIPEENSQQRRLTGPIATDESDLHVFVKRDAGIVEQHLVAVTFDTICKLKQD